ncbi:hypothetical protein [Diaphorobacter nitroreducens]|uniref:hypothetical protein n=1 Tax=Diaphorobacter nitroreducens TaxID=164759 RepID=UPI0024E2094E|nr:hypothetical protein [Diaphorobacter nitroreducens]
MASNALPCSTGRITHSDSSMKKLRQKVTSKLRAWSRWRVTTPAMDHMKVTATISQTARAWPGKAFAVIAVSSLWISCVVGMCYPRMP